MPFVSSFRRSGLLPAALASVLVGCSMHPLPEDVTRVSTVDIVRSIRCEVLHGLKSLYDTLTPEERSRAEPIVRATKIGYDFTFTIEENNGLGAAEANKPFLKLKRDDHFTLNLSGSAALKRENLRRFKIIEPLMDVATEENKDRCLDRTPGANWTYPIAGTIGLGEVVHTYVKLELLSELQEAKKSAAAFSNTHVVFSDELRFTTVFRAGATTTLVLDAVVGHLSVTNASIGVDASRSDVHSVIVAMTRKNLDVDEKRRPAKGGSKAGLKSARVERKEMVDGGSVRDPRTQARLIQMDAEASKSVAIELERRRSLDDRDNEAATALGQRLLDVLKGP